MVEVKGWNHLGGLGRSGGFMAKVMLRRLTVNQELKFGGEGNKCIDLHRG